VSQLVSLPTPRPPWIFRARPPTDADVEALVAQLTGAPFTYPDVGATAGEMPVGWVHDTATGVVGHGEDDAARAEAAVRSWTMFDLSWVRPHRRDVPQQVGQMMAFTAFTLGFYTINVCRVVHRVDADDGVVRRSGFAYGTLPGHALAGEERFELTFHRESGEVRFTIRKFARPNHLLAHLGGPIVRYQQRRFSIDAVARITRAVQEAR